MRTTQRVVLLALILAVTGCASALGRGVPAPPPPPTAGDAVVAYSGVPMRGATDGRVVLRNAALALRVPRIEPTRERAVTLVQQQGGRLDRDNGGEDYASLRFRVPDALLDSVTEQLAALGEVTARSSSAEDRSVEAADLDARISNLRAARDRLRALAQRAESVADVVTVERELTRVQGELDSLEAQLRVLRDRAALATLDLQLQRQVVLGPLGWVLKGTGSLLGKLFVWR